MTEQTATRFDIDFLDTAATIALAEAEPSLLAAIADRESSARLAGAAMSITDLKKAVPSVRNGAKATKADWVDAYVAQVMAQAPCIERRKRLTGEANVDRNLAYMLNEMLKQADHSKAAMERLHEEHPQDRMRKLRSHLINLHVGEIAARVLCTTIAYGTDLREAVQHEFVAAVQVVLRYADAALEGTSSFLSEEQVAAANAFRRNLGGVMPPMEIPARRFA